MTPKTAEETLDEIEAFVKRVANRLEVARTALVNRLRTERGSEIRETINCNLKSVDDRLHEVNSIAGCISTYVYAYKRNKHGPS